MRESRKSGFCEGRTTARGASTRPMKYLCISSFKMIIDLIKSGYGISFVYEVLAKSDPELGIFTLKGEPIVREFNVSYLKHADVREKFPNWTPIIITIGFFVKIYSMIVEQFLW